MASSSHPNSKKNSKTDAAFMRTALGLAMRGLGSTWPNPSVGCVLVRDARVIARGSTQAGGRPHAETVALDRAGAAASGATAYVSLEPCSHHGETSPCADALIDAGIARVVIGATDPHPSVDGAGVAKLEAAGIDVEIDVLGPEARRLNAGFFLAMRAGRPLVTLKTATTLDGRIAVASGASQWLTGSPARRRAHLLRAQNDAVMVGVGTAIADNPELTCRLAGLADRSPIRIIVDSSMRLPLTHKVVASATERPTWIVTLDGGDAARKKAFRDCGVTVLEVGPDAFGHPDIADALAMIGTRGITRLLVEGGSRLAAAFLRSKMVDRLAWFRAPSLIGGDGYPAALLFGVETLPDMPTFQRDRAVELGDDVLETYIVTG